MSEPEAKGEEVEVGKLEPSEEADVLAPTMSKKQMKKLKRREAYLEHRKEKRVIEKERKKAKRQAMKEAGIDVRKKPCYAMASSNCKQTIAIDMGFSDYMNAKDIAGTVNQLAYSYSANRHTENPAQFSIVNFTGTCREHFDKSETTKNWDVNITEKGLKEALPDHKIVYLTADSDNVVTELDESCVYVIGGLIDHNAHKGLTLRLAEENGFEHARLPLSEHVTLQTRKVLTINHVFEILLHYTWSKDWRQAFLSVIPERKGIAANDGEKKDVEAKEDRAEDEGEPEKEEN